MNVIEVEGVSKTFSSVLRSHSVEALRGVSLSVGKGEVFGLLGPNGAGKTTLVKILLGICFKSAGHAKILGESVPSVASRRRLGFLPEDLTFPGYMTGKGAMKAFGRIMRVKNLTTEVPRLLNIVSMGDSAHRKIKKYSKGMRRRIGLAIALLNDPDVLFLDEPTEGLDPMGRRYIKDLLLYLKGQGKTVFLNSHVLSEIETVCDRVAILRGGELVRVGTLDEIRGIGSHYRIALTAHNEEMYKALKYIVQDLSHDENEIKFQIENETDLDKAVDTIRKHDVGIRELIKIRDTLEEAFLKTVGGNN